MNCFLCNESFSVQQCLLDHLTTFHGTPSSFTYKCTACKPAVSFPDLRRYKRHVGVTHVALFEATTAATFKSTDRDNTVKIPIITHDPPLEPTLQDQPSGHPTSERTNEYKEDNKEKPCTEEDILDIRNSLRESFLNFSQHLYGKKHFTRKDVLDLQRSITEEIIKPICDTFMKIAYFPDGIEYQRLINDICDPWQFISTEQKFVSQMKNLGFDDKVQVVEFKNESNKIVSKGCLMPIKDQIKQYFESGSIFQETMLNMKKLEQTKAITNVVHGALWQSAKNCLKNMHIIPYFVFSDEAEMNDAIGAHSGTHKVWGIYYQFPTIPPHYLGRLENIFVAGFIKASDVTERGPSKAFEDLIDILIDIEKNGIILNIGEETFQVHFVLAGILGDNLGMNTLMGYSSSFSSIHYCRFCKMTKYNAQEMVHLDPNLRRTKENYALDLAKDFKETGIKEESAFNKLQCYHVADHSVVDPMHDLYSHGICSYDLSLVLRYMIQDLKISLHVINYRIQMFNYGDTEKRNLFRKITRDQIKSTSFKMTAREMQLFVHYFPLLFGDLIPENNEVWNFVLSLVELTDLILLPAFNNQLLKTLEEQTVLHHTLYKKLFNEKLKPKYHILLHYVETIKEVGPPRYTWSFRFEAFHQVFKQYCRNITSRKNICLTLCKKAKLIFYENLNRSNFFEDKLEFKNPVNIKLIDMPYFPLLDVNSTQLSLLFRAVSRVQYRRIDYKKGYFVTRSSMNIQKLELYEIQDLLITNEECFLVGQEWEILEYSNHFASFVVGNSIQKFVLINVDDVDGPPIHLYTVGNKNYIRFKKYFV